MTKAYGKVVEWVNWQGSKTVEPRAESMVDLDETLVASLEEPTDLLMARWG